MAAAGILASGFAPLEVIDAPHFIPASRTTPIIPLTPPGRAGRLMSGAGRRRGRFRVRGGIEPSRRPACRLMAGAAEAPAASPRAAPAVCLLVRAAKAGALVAAESQCGVQPCQGSGTTGPLPFAERLRFAWRLCPVLSRPLAAPETPERALIQSVDLWQCNNVSLH